MAIPITPTGFVVQTENSQVFISWDITPTATSYNLQRSTDGVTFSVLTFPTVNKFLDTTVVIGTQYFYQVAAINTSGTSSFTTPQTAIPTPNGEMSLLQLRVMSQQKADKVNSNFITTREWNNYINLAYNELYDLIVTVYDDYFLAPPARFLSDGTTYLYPLPDGKTTYIDPLNNTTPIAPAFYKLLGVDLGLNSANNANVTMDKFSFYDRNKFVYPNSAGTIYGVFNLQYRLMGNQIMFTPVPTANQPITLWYIPRLTNLLQDTDITTIGYSGWLQYVICRAAKYALDKEESDTSVVTQELLFLKNRIEESAMQRDSGRPDTITETRGGYWGDWGNGFSGPNGGW